MDEISPLEDRDNLTSKSCYGFYVNFESIFKGFRLLSTTFHVLFLFSCNNITVIEEDRRESWGPANKYSDSFVSANILLRIRPSFARIPRKRTKKRFPKWKLMKTERNRVGVDVCNGNFWKRWRKTDVNNKMFPHRHRGITTQRAHLGQKA